MRKKVAITLGLIIAIGLGLYLNGRRLEAKRLACEQEVISLSWEELKPEYCAFEQEITGDDTKCVGYQDVLYGLLNMKYRDCMRR